MKILLPAFIIDAGLDIQYTILIGFGNNTCEWRGPSDERLPYWSTLFAVVLYRCLYGNTLQASLVITCVVPGYLLLHGNFEAPIQYSVMQQCFIKHKNNLQVPYDGKGLFLILLNTPKNPIRILKLRKNVRFGYLRDRING